MKWEDLYTSNLVGKFTKTHAPIQHPSSNPHPSQQHIQTISQLFYIYYTLNAAEARTHKNAEHALYDHSASSTICFQLLVLTIPITIRRILKPNMKSSSSPNGKTDPRLGPRQPWPWHPRCKIPSFQHLSHWRKHSLPHQWSPRSPASSDYGGDGEISWPPF